MPEDVSALLGGHIQGEGAFAPVEQVVGGRTVPPVLTGDIVGKGAVEAAGAGDVRAARAFNLDDLGPQVGKLPTGIGQSEDVGGVQDSDAFQRQSGHGAFPLVSCRSSDDVELAELAKFLLGVPQPLDIDFLVVLAQGGRGHP